MRSARGRVRRGSAVLAAVLTLAATMATQSQVAAQPATPATDRGEPDAARLITLDGVGPGRYTVTLITGDRVTLTSEANGQFTTRVERASRPDGSIPTINSQDDQSGAFVIPSDAWPMVAAGRLDRDLFNVKYLIENGFGDAESTQLPVIVQYPGTARSTVAAAQALPASTATADLQSIHASAVAVPKAQAGAFWQSVRGTTPQAGRVAALGAGLNKVWLDKKVHADLAESVPLIGAPQAWARGHDGTGAMVAVLDTGIDATHPDFAGKVVQTRSFVPGVDNVVDGNGHGTHVASTIAGSGAADNGKYVGVAPGAKLAIGKVLDDSGSGAFSQIVEGMEWAASSGADVVSMSLGGDPSDGSDPVSQAVNDLTASTGTLFVIAAGNFGQDRSIGTPGSADAALTVAATDKSDGLASFSSRGPRGDDALKPDIAAPGVSIVAARAAGFSIPNPRHVDEHYTTLSGTSMATPHVAGAAAILAVQHPDWPPAQLKAALMSTSTDAGHSVYEQGAGRLDVARADAQQVLATTANLDFGNQEEGAGPATRQVEYSNATDQPVTLTLTPSLTRVGGEPADGAVSAESSVTVPAHGTATTSVTLTPDALGKDLGTFGGSLTATADGVVLRTPIGVVRAPKTVVLTLHAIARDGQPVDQTFIERITFVALFDVTGRFFVNSPIEFVGPGTFRVRVPESTYSITEAFEWVSDDYRLNWSAMVNPQVSVAGDTDVTFDARKLTPFRFDTPQPSEQAQVDTDVLVLWYRTGPSGARSRTGTVMANFYKQWMLPTERPATGDFFVNAQFAYVKPPVEMSVRRPRSMTLHPIDYPHEFDPSRPEFAGTQTATLVDAGSGRPEDLAGKDLRGKLVLLDDDPTDGNDCGISSVALDRVHAAGATGALVWPTGELGSCGLMPIIPLERLRFDSSRWAKLPYVSVPPTEGRALRGLLAAGPVSMTVTGTPQTPYSYSISLFERGRVPNSLHYRFTDRDFAQVDTVLHASEPTRFTFDGSWRLGADFDVDFSAPPSRIGPGTLRQFYGPLYPDVIHSRSVLRAGDTSFQTRKDVFDRPTRTVEHVGAGPVTPIATRFARNVLAVPLPDGRPFIEQGPLATCAMCRQGDRMWPQANATRDDRYDFGGGFVTHLFRNGVEIPVDRRNGTAVPPEPGEFRAVWDDVAGTSAEWTWHSAGTATEETTIPGVFCRGSHPSNGGSTEPCRAEPAVFVSYELGSTLSLDNTVLAGRTHTFTANAFHSLSTAAMPRIAGLKIWTSTDDGRTWVPAQVRGGRDGGFTVQARYPSLERTTGTVDLRAEAWDAAGNRVTMTSTRAFGLRAQPMQQVAHPF